MKHSVQPNGATSLIDSATRVDLNFKGGVETYAFGNRYDCAFYDCIDYYEQLANVVITGLSYETVTPTASVPEPETYAMMLAGLGLLRWATRRRKNQ